MRNEASTYLTGGMQEPSPIMALTQTVLLLTSHFAQKSGASVVALHTLPPDNVSRERGVMWVLCTDGLEHRAHSARVRSTVNGFHLQGRFLREGEPYVQKIFLVCSGSTYGEMYPYTRDPTDPRHAWFHQVRWGLNTAVQ